MTELLIAITFFIRAKFLPITSKAKDMISPGIAFFSFDAGVQEHTAILFKTIYIYINYWKNNQINSFVQEIVQIKAENTSHLKQSG